MKYSTFTCNCDNLKEKEKMKYSTFTCNCDNLKGKEKMKYSTFTCNCDNLKEKEKNEIFNIHLVKMGVQRFIDKETLPLLWN